MNIFVTNLDPWLAAFDLCDKHVVKMVLETTQILSTVASQHNGNFVPYKPTHVHHPCVRWAGLSKANWAWLVEHGKVLAFEYRSRYGKTHKCESIIKELARQGINGNGAPPDGELTEFVQAMPDKYKCDDVVTAYRAYYVGEKARFAKWRYSNPPAWFTEQLPKL